MKNVKKLKDIIRKDCSIRYVYYRDGETCAIGAIALAAGVSKSVLEAAAGWSICSDSSDEAATIRNAIREEFGLTDYEMARIQGRNDVHGNQESRRRDILLQIEEWEKVEARQ